MGYFIQANYPRVISLGYILGSYDPSWKVERRPRNFSRLANMTINTNNKISDNTK